ncbi:hypothetical protein, conserved [Trypanosoma brucei gambiense DAL972]|uniref:Uncharacterized protein n=3 Tax=Trypanosoma brucei TaxID=5691 RepID=Q57ZM1_TRYB2|nr:hypothetical protein, conserved [Trypanosoma brucei gambiense DAL972]XP_843884.1 hypothetical protein, conserved [Trypanosoma brucei brucei TREU927]AAX79461.1 hypothetical protein, conserved [Trypanosoma brucei]RHW73780.1 hypothetical protein DPX39_030028200 [Trypanosoma brucei equiperdum]AAZ10325.1 hypothetical protein, conserved [Trypanosoma brucei brucei TREU927]CBH09960.1 hypothetical protein, conserved [Trypanosoma brucei gambiense DAL972]|eukprot:XP_011772251.1 hypothetical protein, conserved [Trypanosoma brucei gambiense DAL972]
MGRQSQKERNLQKRRSEGDRGDAAADAAREELVRARLLAELSTLREKHDKLSIKLQEPEEDLGGSFGNWIGGSPAGAGSDWRADGAARGAFLGQDDRDAIEALFNESNDSFTREFNEGSGSVERDGIPEKMMSSVR